MHDGVDAALEQHLIEAMGFVEVGNDEAVGGHGGAMAVRQVVHDPDVMPARQKEAHGVAADVAGAAGNQDAHGVKVPSSKVQIQSSLNFDLGTLNFVTA